MDLRHRAFDLAFRAAALTGANRWAAPFSRGKGVILTLHRVCPASPDPFQPNGILEITPAFLDSALAQMRAADIDLVSMDEALSRLGRGGRFFAALTFDDGFRDTLDVALPILRKHGAPAMVYCVPGFAGRSAPLWWVDLEEAVRRLDHVEMAAGDARIACPAHTPQEKQAAFTQLYKALRAMPEPALRSAVLALAEKAGHDSAACAARLCLDWGGLAELAADPLISIGAHTMTHPRLATLPEQEARDEMESSRRILSERLGREVRHFAYPVGDLTSAGARDYALAAELGFASAVTTRPGHLHQRHNGALTSLPRVSLNGLHQNSHALGALLSGLPFLAMRN